MSAKRMNPHLTRRTSRPNRDRALKRIKEELFTLIDRSPSDDLSDCLNAKSEVEVMIDEVRSLWGEIR